jgi:hypothetical protein
MDADTTAGADSVATGAGEGAGAGALGAAALGAMGLAGTGFAGTGRLKGTATAPAETRFSMACSCVGWTCAAVTDEELSSGSATGDPAFIERLLPVLGPKGSGGVAGLAVEGEGAAGGLDGEGGPVGFAALGDAEPDGAGGALIGGVGAGEIAGFGEDPEDSLGAGAAGGGALAACGLGVPATRGVPAALGGGSAAFGAATGRIGGFGAAAQEMDAIRLGEHTFSSTYLTHDSRSGISFRLLSWKCVGNAYRIQMPTWEATGQQAQKFRSGE